MESLKFSFLGEQGEPHNLPLSSVENSEDEFYDAEILDDITTSRGELKHRTLSAREGRSQMVSI